MKEEHSFHAWVENQNVKIRVFGIEFGPMKGSFKDTVSDVIEDTR